jgi:hypothetical protein
MWGAFSDEKTVCRLKLLLVLASAVILGSESHFYSLRYETSFFVASYDSQGYGGGIRLSLQTGFDHFYTWGSRYIASGRTQQETLRQTVFLLLLCAVTLR